MFVDGQDFPKRKHMSTKEETPFLLETVAISIGWGQKFAQF